MRTTGWISATLCLLFAAVSPAVAQFAPYSVTVDSFFRDSPVGCRGPLGIPLPTGWSLDLVVRMDGYPSVGDIVQGQARRTVALPNGQCADTVSETIVGEGSIDPFLMSLSVTAFTENPSGRWAFEIRGAAPVPTMPSFGEGCSQTSTPVPSVLRVRRGSQNPLLAPDSGTAVGTAEMSACPAS